MAWKQLELRLFGKGFCLVVVLTGLAMASFSPGIGRVDAVQEVGLVAHYQFENNVQDSTGSNHGTNHGATFVEGKLGTALHFDGVDDYVEVHDAAVLRLTPPFTLEAWVHPEGEGSETNRNNPIIWKLGSVGTNEDNYGLGWGSSTNCGGISHAFIIRIERASDDEDFRACSYSHPINQWYHVVGLYDGTTLQIYVNGVLEGEDKVGSILPYTGSAPLQIGGLTLSNAQSQGSFTGTIDEVRIYNRILSTEEIALHYSDVLDLETPIVTVVSPNGGEFWRETQTITWTATDPQADPLTYMVYYSPNGGQNWTQLATGLTASSYRWETTTVMAGTNCMIKVEASDGTHTGADVSNTPFEIVYEPTTTAPSEMGRIVVLADLWPICDRYWSPSANMFTLNTFGWLTEFTQGKRILQDSNFHKYLRYTHMVDTLQTNGYTVEIKDTSSLITGQTPVLLENYDVLLINIGPICNQLLTEYVKGGGGVFLIGGTGGIAQGQYDRFLLNFGMSLHKVVDLRPTLTSFVPHPVTTGVSSLRMQGPTPIEVHSSDPQVLATFGGWNCLVVYSQTETLTMGLVAHYQFENNVQDSAGSNHGTNHGATFVDGKLGTALHFDGVDDYVNIEPWPSSLEAFTVLVWIKTTMVPEPLGGDGRVIVGFYENRVNLNLLGLHKSDGKLYYYDPEIGAQVSSKQVNDGAWHLIGYSLDQTNHGVLYIDGSPVTSFTTKTRPMVGATISIGQDWDAQGPSEFFEGIIDELRIYDSPLSLEEVQQHYEILTSQEAPAVTLVSPNGGEYWGGAQTITWTATDLQGDPLTYMVNYSPNGGQTWTQLATGLTASSYRWDTTTVSDGANYLIQVEASDGIHTGVDISNALFEISNEVTNTAPTVRVLQPNGGERIRGTFEIQWSVNDPDGDPLTFTINYSPNEGQTWTQIASRVTETSYMWDTSGVQVGTTYLIKIEASDEVLRAEDRSDAPFTVEREVPTETRSEAFFVPSFKAIEAIGALLVLLALGERRRRRNMLLEAQ